MNEQARSLEQGQQILKEAAQRLPTKPGVYQMLGEGGQVLYVGKACQLKNRVMSYTLVQTLPNRLKRMISLLKEVQVTVTHTETEALLLESNLIKSLKPPYNILLRDDKSFAYLKISHHEYPRLTKHRGKADGTGDYFGPYASTQAVNETIETLFRIFRLRSCTDGELTRRQRPCLQYHIKKCSAPCVRKISPQEYATHVTHVKAFLSQKSSEIFIPLRQRMEEASDSMDYEKAAVYRDQIQALSHIQSQQDINISQFLEVDLLTLVEEGGWFCLQVTLFRQGRHCGGKPFFFKKEENLSPHALLHEFLLQFYEGQPPAREIFSSHLLEEETLVLDMLSEKYGKKISFSVPSRGAARKVVEQALLTTAESLVYHLSEKQNQQSFFLQLQKILKLEKCPCRIEVYDNSHLFGKDAFGVFIVATPEGFEKKSYRKFKLKETRQLRGGDDYQMMREVMMRRFSGTRSECLQPDLLLIDGGKGQLKAVWDTLQEQKISEIDVVAIAKGPERHKGREILFKRGEPELRLDEGSPLLYFLQRLRDEAHRFAIGAHRKKRQKNLEKSSLDEIPGLGTVRKKRLLQHFGSSYNVRRAGVGDLSAVEGIHEKMAKRIYEFFHSS